MKSKNRLYPSNDTPERRESEENRSNLQPTRAHTHTRTHTHPHAGTHAHTHARTQTRTHAPAYTRLAQVDIIYKTLLFITVENSIYIYIVRMRILVGMCERATVLRARNIEWP